MSSEPSRRVDVEEPTIKELRAKLTEEADAYASLLAKLDALAENPAPYDRDADIPRLLESLNADDALVSGELARPTGGGLRNVVSRWMAKLIDAELAPIRRDLERQKAFNSKLVQFLNRFAEATNRAAAGEAELASALVGFAQRIDRLADAKDRLYASLGNRRADLLLEAMDKRLETVRLGVRKTQQRLEGMSSALALARAELSSLAEGMESGGTTGGERITALESFEDAHYVAFEERFRGDSPSLHRRLRGYVEDFQGKGPIVELGCGRGEFLDLLREAGIEARGVDGNRAMVHACREKGLEAELTDLIPYVAGLPSGSVGGLFAAQVIEHLTPHLLREVLGHCFRALRPEGRLVLETVNPRSLVALVDAFYRDLTHQKPIHPDTLEFLLRAVGFEDVSIRYQSPVSERSRLLPVTPDVPEHDALNRNFEKLNALLFADQDYAAIATK